MMRVLYLTADPGVPVLGGKGASVHVRGLARGFHEIGNEVTIASPRVEPGENSLPPSISLVPIPAILPKTASSEDEVRDQALVQAAAAEEVGRAVRPDLVYERYSLYSVAGTAAARTLGVPLLLEVNAPLRDEAARYRELRYEAAALAAEDAQLAAAARVFAVSEPLAAWLARRGVAAGKLEVMPNAFPQLPFAPKRPLDDGAQVVAGFAGGLKRWHGVDVLLDAFARALDRDAQLRLEVAGEGPCEDLVRAAPLPSDRFRWLGHLPHDRLLRVLESWDVGLAPFTSFEGFYFSPLKLNEYMAAGLCPVVSDIGPLREAIDGGRAGVLAPPGDPEALADALVALDRDRARLRVLGERARERAAAGPTWADNARRVLSSLRESPAGIAINGRAAP